MVGYSKEVWKKGREQFKCDDCPFTSFREEEIEQHVAVHRKAEENVARVVATEAVEAPASGRRRKEVQPPEDQVAEPTSEREEEPE